MSRIGERRGLGTALEKRCSAQCGQQVTLRLTRCLSEGAGPPPLLAGGSGSPGVMAAARWHAEPEVRAGCRPLHPADAVLRPRADGRWAASRRGRRCRRWAVTPSGLPAEQRTEAGKADRPALTCPGPSAPCSVYAPQHTLRPTLAVRPSSDGAGCGRVRHPRPQVPFTRVPSAQPVRPPGLGTSPARPRARSGTVESRTEPAGNGNGNGGVTAGQS